MAMKSLLRVGRVATTRAPRAMTSTAAVRIATRRVVPATVARRSAAPTRAVTLSPVARGFASNTFAEVVAVDQNITAENDAHRERVEHELTEYGSIDNKFEKYQIKEGNGNEARAFTYGVLGAGRFVYSGALRGVAIALVASWSASADVLAMATTEVDISKIVEGTTATIKWRGKPVFIRHRTDREIESAIADNTASMVDQEADEARRTDPKWLVVLGVCTHLGCVPIPNAGDYKGWFCPCHGSHYDTSGRIRKGPAPLNLEVPTHKFLDPTKLLIG